VQTWVLKNESLVQICGSMAKAYVAQKHMPGSTVHLAELTDSGELRISEDPVTIIDSKGDVYGGLPFDLVRMLRITDVFQTVCVIFTLVTVLVHSAPLLMAGLFSSFLCSCSLLYQRRLRDRLGSDIERNSEFLREVQSLLGSDVRAQVRKELCRDEEGFEDSGEDAGDPEGHR